MTNDLTFSDLKRMLRLLEVSDKVCLIKSDMEGRFKFINETTSKLFEISDSNFLLKNLFADPDDWTDLEYKLKGEHLSKDLIYLLKSTSNKSYWTNISFEKSEDNHIYWVIKDISRSIKQKQELGQQHALLEKSKNEMDRIIYSASHDLRSPISSILGLLNLLNIAHTDKERKEYIYLIQSSVMKLDSLVQTLGRISKNSNETLKDEKIEFEALFDLVKDELSFHSNYQKVTFNQNFDQNYIFYNDLDRITLVIYNILKNCLDFIDYNKPRNIVEIEIICKSDKVIIRIFDNGIGISKSTIGRVFDLFYRGSDRSKGSGMGLFESKEAIVKLGGKIKLNSEYTLGTSIEIEIPNSKKGKLINKKNSLIN
ncbi:MAG: sensor histidine kinase [Bacteroidota bacterium]